MECKHMQKLGLPEGEGECSHQGREGEAEPLAAGSGGAEVESPKAAPFRRVQHRKNVRASKQKKPCEECHLHISSRWSWWGKRGRKKKKSNYPLKCLTHGYVSPPKSGIQSYTLQILKETSNWEIKRICQNPDSWQIQIYIFLEGKHLYNLDLTNSAQQSMCSQFLNY